MAKVLIIDDSKFSRMKLAFMLAEHGYDVQEAENGSVALETIGKHQPDCVLCDLMMPEMNGLEFLKVAAKEDHKIPVIIVTADIQASTAKEALSLGALAVIHKPPKGGELAEAVRSALEQGSSR